MERIPPDQEARLKQLHNKQLYDKRRRSINDPRHICVTKLNSDAIVPSKSNEWDAGFDIYAAESLTILPGTRGMIHTGISMAIPRGYAGLIWPRSGLALKLGIDTLAGVIDSDYRGEVCVVLQNHGDLPYEISQGDRVAQMVIHELPVMTMRLVDELVDTDRGEGGFGSTGV